MSSSITALQRPNFSEKLRRKRARGRPGHPRADSPHKVAVAFSGQLYYFAPLMRSSKLFLIPQLPIETRPEQTSHNRPLNVIFRHPPALAYPAAGTTLLRVWATFSLFALSYLPGYPWIALIVRQLS